MCLDFVRPRGIGRTHNAKHPKRRPLTPRPPPPLRGGEENNLMIELIHVSKKYGAKLAVNDLHLTIQAGEMFAFLGPNGAGKTTTIKMLCGLLFPTSGGIRIAGFDLETQGKDARQRISYV